METLVKEITAMREFMAFTNSNKGWKNEIVIVRALIASFLILFLVAMILI